MTRLGAVLRVTPGASRSRAACAEPALVQPRSLLPVMVSAWLSRYWSWLKGTEDQYALLVGPTLTGVISTIAVVMCVTLPVGLVLQLAGVDGGWSGGLGVAVMLAFPIVLVAKVQAWRGRDREDKWRPTK